MSTVHRRGWLLPCLAALGAAGMFLGPDGWLGIEISPVGAAVLYAAQWQRLIHPSKHSEEAFPVVATVLHSGNGEAMKFDERDLRIQHAASRAGSGPIGLLIANTRMQASTSLRYRRVLA